MRRLPCILALLASSATADLTAPIVSPDVVFEEKDGLVAIEAEHFVRQEAADVRAWYLTTRDQTPDLKPDGDPSHIAGASGGAYLEILPDTRRTHGDPLITGQNFSNEPGKLAILTYNVFFNTPGTYWLWARAFTTTSEDNGLHFGINGTWPDTAQRWQTVTRDQWHWQSRQRTAEVHVGVPGILTLDVEKPGRHEIHVSMREDGIALDKILLVNRKDYKPEGLGPKPVLQTGTPPRSFPMVTAVAVPVAAAAPAAAPTQASAGSPMVLQATAFNRADSRYYLDRDQWLAIDPDQHKSAKATTASPFPEGRYDLTLMAVGENDGESTYRVTINGESIGTHTCPLATETYEEGTKFHKTFKAVKVAPGDVIEVSSTIGSKDGEEWSRARWSGLTFVAADAATKKAAAGYVATAPVAVAVAKPKRPTGPPLQQPRQPDGDGSVTVTGERKQWHKVTLTLNGPYAHEKDNEPNPFSDRAFEVTFTHESGAPSYRVPGYFAADGQAAESSAEAGTAWRAHLAPDRAGAWTYRIHFADGKNAALDRSGKANPAYDGRTGQFSVAASDKALPDLRARGRLLYVGRHHLQFAGDKTWFLKAGADAPETLLGYADFDGTVARKPNVPLKHFAKHVGDWKPGDPTWKDGKGKGLIGAVNYLSSKGINVYSFLPYNAGGDGDNIWPFIDRDDKLHYDCSKLDQWGIVFDHSTAQGLYLHFKMQENEMDDDRLGQKAGTPGSVPTSLDGGRLGPERKLYCRELAARFAHALALNWNIGEENTQSTDEIKDMIGYIRTVDPYQHHVVIHTFPNQQDKQYTPLLGFKGLTGTSLQNEWSAVHRLTAKWIRASAEAGHPWVCANDEQGSASLGVPPDPDYPGVTDAPHTIDDIRKATLWGNLMAGGAGVEYYFGYKLAENDLVAEDWRSRDRSWDYCRIALDFFRDQEIPFQDMTCRDDLIGNDQHDNSKYCLAKDGAVYLVYLPEGGSTEIALPGGRFSLGWFNPRTGDMGEVSRLRGTTLTAPDQNDWLAVIRR